MDGSPATADSLSFLLADPNMAHRLEHEPEHNIYSRLDKQSLAAADAVLAGH